MIGEDSAAIIYTSGSTGLPKGIVLSHRNLWDGARIISNYLGHGPDDRLAQILSLNFDYGLNQVFGALHVGAQMLLPSLQEKMELLHSLLPQGAGNRLNLNNFNPSNFNPNDLQIDARSSAFAAVTVSVVPRRVCR